MRIKQVNARCLEEEKPNSRVPTFAVEIIDFIQRNLKFSKFCDLFQPNPSPFCSNTINDIELGLTEAATVEPNNTGTWIPSTNLWTALAMNTGDYLRRFRWKSGLGIVCALYLIATLAFIWMSLDDEGEASNDQFGLVSDRSLLSSAGLPGTYLVLLSGAKFAANEQVALVKAQQDGMWHLPQFPDGTDCNSALSQFTKNKNVGVTIPKKSPKPISKEYYRNDPNGKLYRICEFSTELKFKWEKAGWITNRNPKPSKRKPGQALPFGLGGFFNDGKNVHLSDGQQCDYLTYQTLMFLGKLPPQQSEQDLQWQAHSVDPTHPPLTRGGPPDQPPPDHTPPPLGQPIQHPPAYYAAPSPMPPIQKPPVPYAPQGRQDHSTDDQKNAGDPGDGWTKVSVITLVTVMIFFVCGLGAVLITLFVMSNRSSPQDATVTDNGIPRDVSDLQNEAGSGWEADNEMENEEMEI